MDTDEISQLILSSAHLNHPPERVDAFSAEVRAWRGKEPAAC